MKFSVLALDYDGTIATHDVLDPSVRSALGAVRAHDVVVMIVSGRILEDLRRVVGDLHLVDAVVAENGAVVHFPESGYTTVVGQAPPEAFCDALREAGIRFDLGRVVVEAEAADAGRILDLVRQLELPLALAFNRGRLMILPQTLSKATGLQRALAILRLSSHNALAIGDAENDHELLRACEVGVAVEWGSRTLKSIADYVLPGQGPAAVADYVRGLANRQRLPVPLHTRRQLSLGHTDDGEALALAVRGRNVLIAGDPKSGKSWVTGLLCEQLVLYGYCLCVLDPEGDYLSLETLPGVTVLGGADPLPRPRDLLRALRHADTSLVIDLSHVSHAEKTDYIRTVLPSLATLRHHTGLPHRVVLDEAHYFLDDADASRLLDFDLNGYTLVSYRASRLHDRVLSGSEAIVVTRESDPREVELLHALCQSCTAPDVPADWHRMLGELTLGEAVLLPVTEEARGVPKRVRLAPRLTPHVRHMAKYIDIPVTEPRAFVFWQQGRATPLRARTLRGFVAAVKASPPESLAGHMQRHDFSRWIGDVFGDYPLAETIRIIEQDVRAGSERDAAAAVVSAVRERYEFLDPVLGPPPGYAITD